MSIQSEINRLSGNVGNTLSALRNTGTNVPSGANSDSMAGLVSQYAGEVMAGKALVAAAVTEKGVETPADATFQQIAENVAAIESGGEKLPIPSNTVGFPPEAAPGEIVYSNFTQTSWVNIVDNNGVQIPVNSTTSAPQIAEAITPRAPGLYLYFVMPASGVLQIGS